MCYSNKMIKNTQTLFSTNSLITLNKKHYARKCEYNGMDIDLKLPTVPNLMLEL